MSGQQSRHREQRDDDHPVYEVIPWFVEELAAVRSVQQLLVVEQQVQEHYRRREHDAGEHLHAQNDDVERSAGKQDQAGRERHRLNIDATRVAELTMCKSHSENRPHQGPNRW